MRDLFPNLVSLNGGLARQKGVFALSAYPPPAVAFDALPKRDCLIVPLFANTIVRNISSSGSLGLSLMVSKYSRQY